MEEIRDTGVRGFLKWLQVQQPDIYKKVAPEITAKVPHAFSDYHGGGWKVAGLTNSEAVAKLNGLGADVTGGINFDSFGFDPSSVSAPAPVDVSTAANDGSSSTSITDMIGGIVKGISSLYMTKQQADIQQQVVNTQLQRAALGLPPLPTSLSNLGVPQVSVGLSTGTGSALAIGAALIGAIFIVPKLLGGSRARR